MRECYVIEDVPADRLQDVIDGVKVDGCEPKVEENDDGTYLVRALCETE
ncbi:hypothetical protein [Paremcibacter congregatus]|nr:hypothetical protein [Paremcibacter congregatus]|tara:strand:+ start:434 stop:580 length:147 start_codon:yes stop_codon:yes gene_type:complete